MPNSANYFGIFPGQFNLIRGKKEHRRGPLPRFVDNCNLTDKWFGVAPFSPWGRRDCSRLSPVQGESHGLFYTQQGVGTGSISLVFIERNGGEIYIIRFYLIAMLDSTIKHREHRVTDAMRW